MALIVASTGSRTRDKELAEKRRVAAQLREPPKKEKEGIRLSHFVTSTKPVAKPTFNQKKEQMRLLELSMKRLTEAELEPGWRKLVQLLLGTSLGTDFPEMHPSAPNLQHPLYWRALGFSSHEPYSDLLRYEEPLEGKGAVCQEDQFVRGRPDIRPNRCVWVWVRVWVWVWL